MISDWEATLDKTMVEFLNICPIDNIPIHEPSKKRKRKKSAAVKKKKKKLKSMTEETKADNDPSSSMEHSAAVDDNQNQLGAANQPEENQRLSSTSIMRKQIEHTDRLNKEIVRLTQQLAVANEKIERLESDNDRIFTELQAANTMLESQELSLAVST